MGLESQMDANCYVKIFNMMNKLELFVIIFSSKSDWKNEANLFIYLYLWGDMKIQ